VYIDLPLHGKKEKKGFMYSILRQWPEGGEKKRERKENLNTIL